MAMVASALRWLPRRCAVGAAGSLPTSSVAALAHPAGLAAAGAARRCHGVPTSGEQLPPRRRRVAATPAERRRRAAVALRRELDVRKASEPEKLALITLSGHTSVTSGTDVWCGIANVMRRVGANIRDAAGTVMGNDELAEPGSALGSRSSDLTFSAHPFGTRLTPFSKSEEDGDSFAVAILVKASIAESSVQEMSHLIHTTFPSLVCTVTFGGVAETVGMEAVTDTASRDVLTGTIRLFGTDKVGQLAGIADVLARCRVTILNLFVTTGFGDRETYEFFDRAGGPLSENVIAIAAFDQEAFDADTLRQEVAQAAKDVGYEVTSIIFDAQESRAGEREALADYYLKRKASIKQYVENSEADDLSFL